MKKRVRRAIFILSLFALISLACKAEPTSPAVNITSIRPYIGGNSVYITTSNPVGSFCPGNSNYVIDLTSNAGKAAYTVAVAALVANKMVLIEIATCGNPNILQSIYLLP